MARTRKAITMAKVPEKTYDELAGTNRGTYEEALASRKVREGVEFGAAVPDTPTGAAVHVNTALTPAPHWAPQPDRVPVPVINDPGVLGSAPSLADLNAAARGTGPLRPVVPLQKRDDSVDLSKIDQGGISEEEQEAEIKAAAESRMQKLDEEVKKSVDNAQADSQRNTTDQPAPKPAPKDEPKAPAKH